MGIVFGIIIGITGTIICINVKKRKIAGKKLITLTKKVRIIEERNRILERTIINMQKIIIHADKSKENFSETMKKIEKEILKTKN